MTIEQAEKLGYRLVAASFCEIGLEKRGRGIRTWWASQFDSWPHLDHVEIQRAIEVNEELENQSIVE